MKYFLVNFIRKDSILFRQDLIDKFVSVTICEYWNIFDSPLLHVWTFSFLLHKSTDIWNVYGECENISVMSGHTGSIQEVHFSPDGGSLYTCSTDKNLSIWDVQTSQRIRKLKGHTGFVNSCQGSRRGVQMLVSGSDDNSIKVWDARKRFAVATYDNTYQVTAVSFNDTTECIITGGIDNDIKVWDMRKNEVLYRLRGHIDTVTGISLSPDGSYVLSNSMDNTLRIWDIRAYAPTERCVKIFTGHQHNFEKNLLRCAWSPGKFSTSLIETGN